MVLLLLVYEKENGTGIAFTCTSDCDAYSKDIFQHDKVIMKLMATEQKETRHPEQEKPVTKRTILPFSHLPVVHNFLTHLQRWLRTWRLDQNFEK